MFLAAAVRRAERIRTAERFDDLLLRLGPGGARRLEAIGRRPLVVGGTAAAWEYADPEDHEDMLSGGLPCTADEYVAVLEDAGLSADASAVRLRLSSTDWERAG